jgi:DNA-directed RNA polymerase subunit RPC12/RpoP
MTNRDDNSRLRWNFQFAVLFWCLAPVLWAGCGKTPEAEAGDSDANGYFCRACSAKFYTERAVFAAHCPACRSTDLAPVVGFLCAKDGHTTITPREGDSVKCERCETRLENIRLPHEKELRAWGGAKKNKADVM